MSVQKIIEKDLDIRPSVGSEKQIVSPVISLCSQALIHNTQQIRRFLSDADQLAFVIKANAYGHGLIEIGQMAELIKEINWLCVFHLSEALLLRKNKIKKPILVVGDLDETVDDMIFFDISCMVDSIDTILKLEKAGDRVQKKAQVHIKIDTGLARFGLRLDEIDDFCKIVSTCQWINVQGTYTHFAESQLDDQSYTDQQILIFDQAIEKIKLYFPHIFYTHAFNSAAVLRRPTDRYNFFRVGIGLYGYASSFSTKQIAQDQYSDFSLIPILTLESSVMNMKQVPEGTFVGYNRTMQTKRQTTLAFIPFGYADGYEPAFSGNTSVIIEETIVPIVGRVAMNVIACDVTDIQEKVKIGSRAILCGKQFPVVADYICEQNGITNVRTFLARLSPHIYRRICNSLNHHIFCENL
jgi:alanine racemase